MPRPTERGVALPIALLVSVVLVLLISAAARYAIGMMSSLEIHRARASALNVAEGGVEWAISRFDPGNLAAITTSGTFAGGVYNLSVRALSGNRYAIRSDAFVPSTAHPQSTRSIEVVVASGNNPLGSMALAANGDTTINGSVTIDSLPQAGQGNVHSNHDLYINGGAATLHGALSASGQAHAASSYGATSQTTALDIPTYTNTSIDSFATQAKNSGTQAIASFNGRTLSGYYSSYQGYDTHSAVNTNGGTITISSGDVTISGVVFIEGRLVISGNAELEGSGTIICTEGITVTGNAEVGESTSPLTLVSLSSTSPAITMSGNPSVWATGFAPNGDISLSGSVSAHGSFIAGGGVGVSGNVSVIRNSNQSIAQLQIPYWSTVSYHEL